jgi:hypothetical protein
MSAPHQELCLWPVSPPSVRGAPGRCGPLCPQPLRLAFAPARLVSLPGGAHLVSPPAGAPDSGVILEPFFARKQLRLFAAFTPRDLPMINGEPGPSLAVLSPGDCFQCATGYCFSVVLYARPQIGPPPAAVLGKPCPVCLLDFAAGATCYTCPCGVVLHCEADKPEALQCAQLRRECPVCGRQLILTEGYVNAPVEDE